MSTGTHSRNEMSDSRVMITDREQNVITGDVDDVKHPGQYQSKVRSRLRDRAERLAAEMAFLREHEPEIADEILERICPDDQDRLTQLERQVQQLQDQIE